MIGVSLLIVFAFTVGAAVGWRAHRAIVGWGTFGDTMDFTVAAARGDLNDSWGSWSK